ncbi:hypothetical protein E1301_Tti009758 [Triplophysa tibetana]|uniref:Uncharacterized protein n=1 Tax=Triplophysa tibetana TaxID=1572043 RepID=A0A5A9NAL1_9TELE|nr:hypothetical protein E1301_Tti009758 [Triplophysa tibetana]
MSQEFVRNDLLLFLVADVDTRRCRKGVGQPVASGCKRYLKFVCCNGGTGDSDQTFDTAWSAKVLRLRFGASILNEDLEEDDLNLSLICS